MSSNVIRDINRSSDIGRTSIPSLIDSDYIGGVGLAVNYFLKSIKDLWAYKRVFFASFVSTILIFICCCLLVFFARYAKAVVAENLESGTVSVYLRESATNEEIVDLKNLIQNFEFVESLSLLSKEKALEEFSQNFKIDFSQYEEVFDSNPLPASIDIRLKTKDFSKEDFSNFKKEIESNVSVEFLEGDFVLIDKLSEAAKSLPLILSIIGVISLLVSIFVISHSFSLVVSKKAEESEILAYLGKSSIAIFLPSILSVFYSVLCGLVVGFLLFSLVLGHLSEHLSVVTGVLSFDSDLSDYFLISDYFLVALVIVLLSFMTTFISMFLNEQK